MALASLSTQLPWQGLSQGAGLLQGLGGDPQQAMQNLGAAYSNNYNAALNLNQSLFSGVQTGYENLRKQLDDQYSGISQGYGKLFGDVLGSIAGTNTTNLRDIDTSYAAQQGKAVQDAMNRGLMNSTVLMNMQRGINLDRSRARTASQEGFAQLGANYMSNIGQAGLQSQMRGADLGAQLGQNQLNWLNTIQAPYPHAQMYTDLAKMYGAQAQGAQDRNALAQIQQPSGLLPRTGGIGGVASGSAGSMFHWGPSMGFGGGTGGGGGYDPGSYFSIRQNNTGGPSPGYFDEFGGYGGGDMYLTSPEAAGAVGGGALAGLTQAGFGMGGNWGGDSGGGFMYSPEWQDFSETEPMAGSDFSNY